MTEIVAAEFMTYGGRKIKINFLFPYPSYKKGHRNIFCDKLAETFGKMTEPSGDPIVKVTQLFYAKQ